MWRGIRTQGTGFRSLVPGLGQVCVYPHASSCVSLEVASGSLLLLVGDPGAYLHICFPLLGFIASQCRGWQSWHITVLSVLLLVFPSPAGALLQFSNPGIMWCSRESPEELCMCGAVPSSVFPSHEISNSVLSWTKSPLLLCYSVTDSCLSAEK